MPGAAITYEVGLDGANAAIVDSGRVQLGLIHSGLGQMAVQGEYPYEKKLDNVRGISLVYSNSALHFVVNAKTGLTSLEQIKQQKYPRVLREIGSLLLPQMRKWDLKASKRPDFLIANSANVQKRIQKFYHRDSVVIPPPVDTQFFHPVGEKQDYFLAASRLEPYKKIDLPY